jgi:hypothetical protein
MNLPLIGARVQGFRTLLGTWLAPGAQATFLGPAGVFDSSYVENNRVATLNAALARIRPSKGDVICCLPGYSESISSADYASSLVAGTRIFGLGIPGETSAPKLTWTAAAATFLLDVADVTIRNMTLDFSGVADCAAPITVSANGCGIEDSRIIMQNDTLSFSAVKGVTLAAGANRFRFNNNTVLTDSEDDDANVTGGVLAIGAAVTGVEVRGNNIAWSCPGDTVGIIDITAAAKQLDIRDNLFYQFASDAAFCIIIGNVAAQGYVVRNGMRITENVAPLSAGLSVGGAALILNWDNKVSASSAADATLVDAADS